MKRFNADEFEPQTDLEAHLTGVAVEMQISLDLKGLQIGALKSRIDILIEELKEKQKYILWLEGISG